MKPKNSLLVFTLAAAAGLAITSTASALDLFLGTGSATPNTRWDNSSVYAATDNTAGTLLYTNATTTNLTVQTTSYTGLTIGGTTNVGTLTLNKANFQFRQSSSTVQTLNFLDFSGTNESSSFFQSSANTAITGDRSVRLSTTSSAAEYSGKFLNNVAAVYNVEKQGSGSLTLSGTANTSTGAIVVTNGSLVITGAVNTFSSLSVSNGATLAGEGNGTSTGMVSAITLNGGVSTGGMLAPGDGTVGDLGSLYGTSLAWNGSTTTAFSQMLFNLATSSATSDLMVLSGAMTKGTGSFFQFDFGGTGDTSVARTYTLVQAASGFGTFSASDFSYTGLDAGIASGSFAIVGNDLQFTTVVVPEPGAALLGGLGMLALLRRRRS